MSKRPQGENGTSKRKRLIDRELPNYIKQKLLYGELRPGDRIPTENELCQILNISRTSVREELKSLAAINLINIRQGDGTYISYAEDINFSDAFLFKMLLSDFSVDELLGFREHIELAVMQMAMSNITDTDMEAMRLNIEKFGECIFSHPENSDELHRLDVEFHTILGRSTGNRLMEDMYGVAWELFSPTIMRNYARGQATGIDAQSTLASHQLLYDALKSKSINHCTYGVCYCIKLWSRWMENARREDAKAEETAPSKHEESQP